MRRTLLLAVALVAGLAAPSAQADLALPTPGFASDNVEWLGNVPLHADSAGARLVDGYFYVTSSSQLSVYDARVPETPRLLSTLPLPQQPYFAEEDVDTNGEVLLVSGPAGLTVVDVRDKALPRLAGVLPGWDEHTVSCVLDCTYAYGSEGGIVDLRDPAAPVVVGDWTDSVPGGGGSKHDVTEVSPGLVMTSSGTMALLDANADPAAPRLVTTTRTSDGRFLHANLWPRQAQDDLLLVGGETAGTDCSSPEAGAFMTYTVERPEDGPPVFAMADEYRPDADGVEKGEALYETYCSHWFDTRPDWQDGGQLAVGWYEHGTRFLQVAADGTIEQNGFFAPVGTTSSAAYWASQDVVYVMDYQRGLDVLRFHGDGEAPPSHGPGLRPDAPPATPNRLLPGMLRASGFRC